MAESRPQNPLLTFLRLSHPLFALGGILVYALGAGVADYLGNTIYWSVYLLGQVWVIALQLGAAYLYEYYEALISARDPFHDPPPGGDGRVGPARQPVTLLGAVAFFLTFAATLTAVMLTELSLGPATLAVMSLLALGAVAFSVPPVRLAFSGYGELVVTILFANLVPAFAFLLQTGDLHRLLAMSTFPLTALSLALALAYELADYAADLKRGRRTLMVRLGWQRGMFLHNGMILGAFLLLGLALTFGLPLGIGLPAFLPLPLGLLQIWQMRRISDGARPNWRALRLTAVVIFATTAYLLTLAFWTR
jgi:1,4-dihydroxy-2-naphthoate octaprenyltransferase